MTELAPKGPRFVEIIEIMDRPDIPFVNFIDNLGQKCWEKFSSQCELLIADNVHFGCTKQKTGSPLSPSINAEPGKTLVHVGVYQDGTTLQQGARGRKKGKERVQGGTDR